MIEPALKKDSQHQLMTFTVYVMFTLTNSTCALVEHKYDTQQHEAGLADTHCPTGLMVSPYLGKQQLARATNLLS